MTQGYLGLTKNIVSRAPNLPNDGSPQRVDISRRKYFNPTLYLSYLMIWKLAFLALALASQAELESRWGNDWPFSGISTFAHLASERCLTAPDTPFDIAFIGVPFDTAVSYRPGARFGPRAIRAASMRQTSMRGFNTRAGINPYMDWATVIDCMDMPVSPVDNKLALYQMTMGFKELLAHPTVSGGIPKLISLGGDHSIVLPHLRALHEIHGPIAVIHFDAHLDTWLPTKYPSGWAEAEADSGHFTHGTMFWMAHSEGLLKHGSCMHAGLRTRLSGADFGDYRDDSEQGFARISCDEIDEIGVEGIIKAIKKRLGNAPAYISVDIDVLDPGMAPGTGTPEVGGWTSRELISILRGLNDLNVVGADIVEVSPSYDHAEITALAGAQIAYEILTGMVIKGANGVHEVPKNDL